MDRDAIAEPATPGDLPPPPAGEVHVWRIALGDGGRAAARRALAEILARYLGGEGAPELVASPAGKPRLAKEPERLSFNLSHSGGLALVAVAPGGAEVGIDVEQPGPRRGRDVVRLATRWLSAVEAAAVADAPPAERERIFYAAWTRFEARVKCAGTGLAGVPPGPEVNAWQLDVGPDHAAALALVAPAEPRVVLRDYP